MDEISFNCVAIGAFDALGRKITECTIDLVAAT